MQEIRSKDYSMLLNANLGLFGWRETNPASPAAACWPVVRSVTANPVIQVCACLPDLFHLAVFSLHFCLRG